MNSKFKSFGLYVIILMMVFFACDFINPLTDENGSLAIKCTIDKNLLSKTSNNSSPLEITRIRCMIYQDGSIKKDFNLTKDGDRFKGSAKLKKGNYDISLEAYDESNFQAYTGSQSGIAVSPMKTTEVTIILQPNVVTLSVLVSPPNAGSISKNPNKNNYNYNEPVQLTASPATGYQFDHWEGDLSGNSNPATITMNDNKSITAAFIQVAETISTPSTPAGTSSGTVGQSLSFSTGGSTSNLGHSVEYRFDWGNGNISNWGSSSQSYTYNNVGSYQVKAQARCQTHTTILSGWSSPLTVSISGHTLTIDISPAGSGSVTKNPDKTEYNHNESVQLIPIPSSNYVFSHWEEDLNGNANPAYITMNGNKSVTAVFIELNIVISGYVKESDGNPIQNVTLTISNGGGSATTNSSGYYSKSVAYGWSGTVTPSFSNYIFSPVQLDYSNVTANQTNQDFTGLNMSADLVAYWPFDGNANDMSGKGFHGTENGGIQYTSGVKGQAAKFDGIDDWIDIGTNHPFTNESGEFTIISWYYGIGDYTRSDYNGLVNLLKDINPEGAQITFGALWENQQHFACFNLSDYRNSTHAGNYGYGYTKSEASVNTWIFLVGTLKNSVFKLYLNGNLVASDSSSQSLMVKGGKLKFGFHSDVYPNRFKGMADEIRIYNRALSESDIKILYDATKSY